MKLTIYLDVDGVLLGHPRPMSGPYVLALHAVEFLRFVVDRFDVAWATTHCRHGDPEHLLEYLAEHTEPDQRAEIDTLARQIRPTAFNVCKTEIFEALPDHEWRWIDDAPLQAELQALRRHGWEDRLLRIDTRRVPDDLLSVRVELEAMVPGGKVN
jgi:hypothetical protein